jgi:DNA-binding CsgD family transcriptional regulator
MAGPLCRHCTGSLFSLSFKQMISLASPMPGARHSLGQPSHRTDALEQLYDVDLPEYSARADAAPRIALASQYTASRIGTPRGTNQNRLVSPKRRQRKRNIAWEQAELASDGLYARNLREVEAQFPVLSPMQLRVCALVKAMLPNWKIADVLGITEKTVENHLRAARKRLGVAPGTRLHHLLASEISEVGR